MFYLYFVTTKEQVKGFFKLPTWWWTSAHLKRESRTHNINDSRVGPLATNHLVFPHCSTQSWISHLPPCDIPSPAQLYGQFYHGNCHGKKDLQTDQRSPPAFLEAYVCFASGFPAVSWFLLEIAYWVSWTMLALRASILWVVMMKEVKLLWLIEPDIMSKANAIICFFGRNHFSHRNTARFGRNGATEAQDESAKATSIFYLLLR